MMHFYPDQYPDTNWCPDCGLPREICDCEENRIAYEMFYDDEPSIDPEDTADIQLLFDEDDEE